MEIKKLSHNTHNRESYMNTTIEKTVSVNRNNEDLEKIFTRVWKHLDSMIGKRNRQSPIIC
eukprot:GAHX01000133.1.p1 GENE.GAHX01000133.1~~GAHX01000133.1.p1  ORF type:complete len:61 (+),score=9.69 GAHX01000133.1:605-787(+)